VAAEADTLDATTRAALQQLADIAVPTRVSFVPRTWGWIALLVILIALAAALAWVWHRRREAGRYRREALAELDLIDAAIAGDDSGGKHAVLALPPLVKRVALAAWPRPEVAGLTGAAWIAFLQGHSGDSQFPGDLAAMFEDAEYREGDGEAIDIDRARSFATGVRHWIETHRVSA
jgi:hypothetical protein